MRKRLLGSAVAIVVMGAAYLVHAVGPTDAVSPTAPGPGSGTGDDRGVATASRTVRPSAGRPVLRATDVIDEPVVPDPAEADARLEAGLARRFDGARVDPAWATTMERAIADTFALPALAGSTLARVSCRGVICRLEIDHADGAAQGRFFAAAGPTPAFRGAGASRPLLDPHDPDRHRTLVYVMREGEPLPTIN